MQAFRTIVIGFAVAAVAAGIGHAQTAKPEAPSAAAAQKHVIVAASDIKWGPAPPSLPAGAQMAVVDGDPSKPAPFVLRAKFPDGFRISPHWHPTDETIVVLAGSFSVGMGDTFNEGSMSTLAPGAYAWMPKEMRHYASAKGETIIQVSGVGPFVVNYVNPQDDPRNKK